MCLVLGRIFGRRAISNAPELSSNTLHLTTGCASAAVHFSLLASSIISIKLIVGRGLSEIAILRLTLSIQFWNFLEDRTKPYSKRVLHQKSEARLVCTSSGTTRSIAKKLPSEMSHSTSSIGPQLSKLLQCLDKTVNKLHFGFG